MPPLPLYDSPQNREDMAAYMTSARIVDRCVGMVREAVRESGHDEDTLLIFTTDHGIAFPHMKCNMYDTGIGVSLIVRFPGNKLRGKAVDALVSQLDLFPTIAEFAGIKRPEWLQGHSLLPLLRGETDRVRGEIFSEVNYHAAYEPMRCVRTDRYKLVRFYDDHAERVPANIDDSPSKSFVIEHGFLHTARDREQLFDLYLDPTERLNVSRDPAYQSVYDDLSARLASWMRETDDPLLPGGRVAKPAGAVVNKRDALSARERDYE
jgi:arylsulfatase A-like enzyme